MNYEFPFETEMAAGGRWIHVEVSKPRKKIHLRFRNFAPLREEIKVMRGAEWRHDEKEWAVTDCYRNRLQLELLQGRTPPELERYFQPLDHYGAARDCLYEHQQEMVDFLLTRRRCILAAEMRTGKTLACIEAMEHVGGEWLYVAPAQTLTGIELEFEKWDAQVTPRFISYAKFRMLAETYDGPAPRGIVFDESSKLKNVNKTSKAAKHFAKAITEEHDGYVFEMTGTPAPLSPLDWHTQAEIACPGYLRESSVSHLERRVGIQERVSYGEQTFARTVDWKEDEVELLGRRLQGLVRVYKLEDCRELPEVRHEIIELEVSETTRRAARLLAGQAETAIGALSVLRQLSDGFQYRPELSPLRTSTPKDGALENLLAEHDECGRLIVFACYRESVDKCVQIAHDAGWDVLRCDGRGWALLSSGDPYSTQGMDTKAALREMDYSAKRTVRRLAFVGHPQSGGMGLTLSASPGIVFYSQDFNGESRRQASARAIGNPSVTIYDLIHLETDRKVLDSHERKEELESITLEEIRNLL